MNNKFCPSCGSKIEVQDSQFCINCGYKFNQNNQSSQVNQGYQNNANPNPNVNYNTYNNNNYQTQNNPSNGMGITGFVISLISLIMCCGSLSWLSLIFSIIGMSKAKKINGAGHGLSVAGLVISIIGLLIFLFYFGSIFMGIMNAASEF